MTDARNFTINLVNDPYNLHCRLPADEETFMIAKELADTVLDDPRSFDDSAVQFNGIRVEIDGNAHGIEKSLPGVEITSVDLRKTLSEKGETLEIFLHDASKAGQVVTLKQQDIVDGMPFRDFDVLTNSQTTPTSRIARTIMAREVVDWLEIQVWGMDELPLSKFNLPALFETLSARASKRIESRTSSFVLTNDRAIGSALLYAAKYAVFDVADITKKPLSEQYTTWITSTFTPDSIHAEEVSFRPLAQFNGANMRDPENILCYDVDATGVRNREELSRFATMYDPHIDEIFQRALQKVRS